MLKTNKQPIEKQVTYPGGELGVHSIWDTIQGEGPFAGLPAVFIRLAGCNLQCPACDTDYTSHRELLKPTAIAQRVRALGRRLVVLTGGEPFRQDITSLVEVLLTAGCKVQIETNGTLSLPHFPYLDTTVVVSPKTPIVHEKIALAAKAWKYVVQAGSVSENDGLPTRVLGYNHSPARPSPHALRHLSVEDIYVQPMDEQDPDKNEANLQEAVRSVLKYGYRLSIQSHKLAGLQ